MTTHEFTDAVFARAREAGLDPCEIYLSRGSRMKITAFDGQVDDYSVNTSVGLSLRGMVDGRMGYAYTEVLDEDAVRMLVTKAVESARVIENDDRQFIFAGSDHYEAVNGWNPGLADIPAEDKIAWTLRMEQAAREADPRVLSVGMCTLNTLEGETTLENSLGLRLWDRENILVAYLAPVVRDGEGMKEGFAYRICQDPAAYDPEKLAHEAVEQALSRLGGASVPSGSYPILLSNEAAADLLSTYSGIFSADAAQKGLSLLKGREGETIAAPCVTLMDDPLLPGGLASAGFDAEGVATRTKAVIEGGVLRTLLHNLKTAAKDGIQTTGNGAKGSYRSPVGVSPFNFFIRPGEKNAAAMMEEIGSGLYITELEGLHSGANTVSGDFSLSAKGFTVTEGKKGMPVEQITVAGNFFDLLKSVQAVGSDLRFGMPGSGCVGSPCLWVKSLSVAGE